MNDNLIVETSGYNNGDDYQQSVNDVLYNIAEQIEETHKKIPPEILKEILRLNADPDIVSRIHRGLNVLSVLVECKVEAYLKQNTEMGNDIENVKHQLSEVQLELKQEKRNSENLVMNYNQEKQELQREVMQLQNMYQRQLNQITIQYNDLLDHNTFLEGQMNSVEDKEQSFIQEKQQLIEDKKAVEKQVIDINSELQNVLKELDDVKLENNNLKDEIQLLHISQKYIKSDLMNTSQSVEMIKLADKLQAATKENELLKKELTHCKSENRVLQYSLQIQQEKQMKEDMSDRFNFSNRNYNSNNNNNSNYNNNRSMNMSTDNSNMNNTNNNNYNNTSVQSPSIYSPRSHSSEYGSTKHYNNNSNYYEQPQPIAPPPPLLPPRNDYPRLNTLLTTPSYEFISNTLNSSKSKY